MSKARRGVVVLGGSLVLMCAASISLAAEEAAAVAEGARMPPPAFVDPHRRDKLTTAFPEIDRIFRGYLDDAQVPGAAWGVLIDGELAHSGAHGVRELDGRTPVDQDTVFRIASMTKSFTALAILSLRDAGRLSLDDAVERYVPELAALVYPTADSPKITIRDLLSHAQGFPEDNPWGDQQLAISDEALTALLTRGIPFSNPPGISYEYSNYGYALLGRIVAVVAGVPFNEYLAREILQPLGLSATTLDPSAVPAHRLAHGYRWEDGQWKPEPPLADGAFGPMGGMLASMNDLARYVGFLMSAWPPRDEVETGPVRRATLREMQQAWRVRPAVVMPDSLGGAPQLTATAYGFGLRVTQTSALSAIVGHAGGLPGYGSLMLWLPEHGVGLIAAGNLTYTAWGPRFDAAFEALAQTGGLEPRRPLPAPVLLEMREAVSRLVIEWDDALAERVAADNLFLDRSKAHRRAELQALRERHGACRGDGPLDVENALRGAWTMPCERDAVRVAITLSPTIPPRVQSLTIRSVE